MHGFCVILTLFLGTAVYDNDVLPFVVHEAGKIWLPTFKADSGYRGPEITGRSKLNYQNSKYQNARDAGPTPEGKYHINLKPDPERIAKQDINSPSGLVKNPEGGIEKTTNGEKTAFNKQIVAAWGENRAHLEPDKVTGAKPDERDNDSYYLHDSNKESTHGCTEIDKKFFTVLTEYRKNGNKKIDVIVDYPNNDYRTGGTQSFEKSSKRSIFGKDVFDFIRNYFQDSIIITIDGSSFFRTANINFSILSKKQLDSICFTIELQRCVESKWVTISDNIFRINNGKFVLPICLKPNSTKKFIFNPNKLHFPPYTVGNSPKVQKGRYRFSLRMINLFENKELKEIYSQSFLLF